MGPFAFFGLLLLSGVAILMSFMFLAFAGSSLDVSKVEQLGNGWEKFLLKLPTPIFLAHMTVAPTAAFVLVVMYLCGNREWASTGVKCMFLLPILTAVFMFFYFNAAAHYRGDSH